MFMNGRTDSLPEPAEVLADRYRIIGTIGKGGMGIVYAVADLKLDGRLMAAKVTASAPDGSNRYSMEAYMLMKLRHPNLPLIADYIRLDSIGCEVLVMEYIEGHTLSEYLAESAGGVPFPLLVSVGLQLCSALYYLHTQTPMIIHRDLKPSNVIIDSKGHARLIDFGISRHYKSGQAQDTTLLGTWGFAAPEQEGGGQSDERTDIYGLGSAALLYRKRRGGLRQRSPQQNTPEQTAAGAYSPPAFAAVLDQMLQPEPRHNIPLHEGGGAGAAALCRSAYTGRRGCLTQPLHSSWRLQDGGRWSACCRLRRVRAQPS